MATWADGIVDHRTWRLQKKRRLLIVCPEPNEQSVRDRDDVRWDMCDLLLHGKATSQFPRFIRQIIRVVHSIRFKTKEEGEVNDHEDLIRKIAFIDLKNTGGGRQSDERLIMRAALARRARLVKRIRSMQPTHIAVAGKAWSAFAAYIFWGVAGPGTAIFRIHHPSCHGMETKESYDHVRDRLKGAIRR